MAPGQWEGPAQIAPRPAPGRAAVGHGMATPRPRPCHAHAPPRRPKMAHIEACHGRPQLDDQGWINLPVELMLFTRPP